MVAARHRTYGLFRRIAARCTTEEPQPKQVCHEGLDRLRNTQRRHGRAGVHDRHGISSVRAGRWRSRDAADAPGIGDVDVVVVGGALYLSRWVLSVRQWVHRHKATLKIVPVWFFSSGPLDDSAAAGDLAPVPQVARLAREVEVSGHMTFGGHLDRRPSGFVARQMARRYAGDWRDPGQVAEWVHRHLPADPASVDHPHPAHRRLPGPRAQHPVS